MQPNTEKKVLTYCLFLAIFASLTLAVLYVVEESGNKVLAQAGEQQQMQQNQTSIAHNAKGHESHQVIIFQNSSNGLKYTGMVTFNLSKPVDVISFEEVTDEQPANATKKIWEVGDKKFAPNTLLKNITEGSVSFNGSGILAHSTSGDKYSGAFTLNDTAISNNNGTSSGNQ
jgi:uncharacterized protein YxeA